VPGRPESLSKSITATHVAIVTLLAAMAFGALTAQKAASIDGAVQEPVFKATRDSIRNELAVHIRDESAHHAVTDSAIRAGQIRLEAMFVRQEQRDCEEKGYPLPWCKQYLPTGGQAGRPR
jgi:hypothetical protein